MHKIIFILSALLALLLFSCTSKTTDKAYNANHDSIQKYIKLASNDTLEFAKRIKYNDKAYSFLDLNRNDSVVRNQLNKVAYNYLLTFALNKTKSVSDIYFDKSKKE